MEDSFMLRLFKKFMSELWGFFALTGLLALHTGIILTVYAIKDVTSHNDIVMAFGAGLILVGIAGVVFSWFIHRQQRERRPLCPCCTCCDPDTLGLESSPRNSGRINRGASESASVFSTPEFRRYSAFLKQQTEGVENSPVEIHQSMGLNKMGEDTPGSPSPSRVTTDSSQGSMSFSPVQNSIRAASRKESERGTIEGIEDDTMTGATTVSV